MSAEPVPLIRFERTGVYGQYRVTDGVSEKVVDADLDAGDGAPLLRAAAMMGADAEWRGQLLEYIEALRNGAESAGPTTAKMLAMARAAERANDPTASRPIVISLADVQPRNIDWLWHGRIPLGRMTMLVGRPGEGKSFATLDMAARISTGTPWPDGAPCQRGRVLLIASEDDPGDTIRPRLDAHGADPSRIAILRGSTTITEDGREYESLITLASLEPIEAALSTMPDCRLIIIDPIGSVMGAKVDAHRDTEVRAVLQPVAKLAETYGVAVLLVAHRRKSGGDYADGNALGSVGLVGICRATWHITRDPEDKQRRLFLPGKNNLGPEGEGLAYRITGQPGRVVWEDGPVSMTADDGVAAEQAAYRDRPGPDPEARSAAADWLTELLQAGPIPAKQIADDCKAAGFSYKTVQRAAEELHITRTRDPIGRGWHWSLSAGQDTGHDTGQNLSSTV